MKKQNTISNIFLILDKHFGWRGWWPSTPPGKFAPEYHLQKNYLFSIYELYEIMFGAILTQNAAWTNVEKALKNLIALKIFTPSDIIQADETIVISAIKPSGYFNQKYKKLKFLSEFLINNPIEKLREKKVEELRQIFLNIWGIGRETADSIVLYAFDKPIFVVDAYTRRILKRSGIIFGNEDYDYIRKLIEQNISPNVLIYKNYHAVIVELCKEYCKTKPICNNCPLSLLCKNV